MSCFSLTITNTYHSEIETESSHEEHEFALTCKKRVVQFIQQWVISVRHAVFEDAAANDFIEVRTEVLNK